MIPMVQDIVGHIDKQPSRALVQYAATMQTSAAWQPHDYIRSLALSHAAISEFCDRKGVAGYLFAMMKGVSQHFLLSNTNATVQVLSDPDDDAEYLEVGVSVRGEPEEVAERYERYIRNFFSQLPVFAQKCFRLSVDIV